MALFANEGDNAIAGIRKRLVEGGHHHNAAGEEQGIFEEGYVSSDPGSEEEHVGGLDGHASGQRRRRPGGSLEGICRPRPQEILAE